MSDSRTTDDQSLACVHEWQRMSWQEAYPASDGYNCVRCGEIKLAWLGANVPQSDLESA